MVIAYICFHSGRGMGITLIGEVLQWRSSGFVLCFFSCRVTECERQYVLQFRTTEGNLSLSRINLKTAWTCSYPTCTDFFLSSSLAVKC